MILKYLNRIDYIPVIAFCLFLFLAGFYRYAQEGAAETGTLTLTFSLELNRRVYDYTDYGEPPQVAIWLEQPDKGVIRTIFVTYRTGKGMWKGRVDCPVSLPYWENRCMEEIRSRGIAGPAIPVPDAISYPTPKTTFRVNSPVAAGSVWNYFIEVNCSADYNRTFPSVLDEGFPDPFGNGQPSLVYRGQIKAEPGQKDMPEVIGRTDQLDPVDTLITDMTGITDATKLLSKIEVSVTR